MPDISFLNHVAFLKKERARIEAMPDGDAKNMSASFHNAWCASEAQQEAYDDPHFVPALFLEVTTVPLNK